MAASANDKWRKSKSLFSTTLSGGINDSVTTVPLNSTVGLPTDTGVTLTIDRTDAVERVTGTVSGSNLINCKRGEDGTSAAAHSSGDTVEAIWDADSWGDAIDSFLSEHAQDGGHDGLRAIYIPATAMWPGTTAGCAAISKTELGTNDIDIQSLDFDKDSDEYAQFALRMPGNWNAGTITFSPHWTAASGSGTVAFTLSGRAYANSDALDQAQGTGAESLDTLLTANDLHEGPKSGAITLAGTPVAGEYCHFKLLRDISEDNLSVDAKLLGIYIQYSVTQLASD